MRDAEVLFEVVAQFFCQHGLPGMLTFDNDPRLVGSPAGRDFPSALVRCKIRVGNKQGYGLKSGINEVSSTVSK